MNVKRILIYCLVAALALALIKFGPLAWILTAGLRTQALVPEPDYWPTDGWRFSTPEEQGFNSTKIAEGIRTLQEKQAEIDSLLIIRNGYVVLDAHFDPYDGTFPHDLASVTKSVMTTLIAIAAKQGKLDLDAPMVSFFPNRTIANLDERKARLTVRNLASMRNGMELGCYEDDEGTLDLMRATPDWVQAALDRPMAAEPGTEFCYDSPGMHLLSAILQEATGMTANDFARQVLFEPLGIQDVLWEVDPQGYTRGWGDLHLLPEDLAKFAYLWLHRGNWDGQQIVSEAWVLDSVKAHSKFVGADFGYGYGWWVATGDYQAAGRNGQKARIIASMNTLVIITAADFDYAEVANWLVPVLIQSKDKLPANPQGTAALAAALAEVAQPSPAWSTHPIPEAAMEISGKTYACDSNPVEIESVRMVFEGSEEARLYLKMDGAEFDIPIGLDGKYRQDVDWTGYRGYWNDANTFQLEAFDIGVLHRTVAFEGNGMKINLPEVSLTVICREQTQ